MKIGKRTAKLLREAIVLAHVEGAFWAGYTPTKDNPYLKDSVVVANVLRSARSNKDLYPTLGRVETEEYR